MPTKLTLKGTDAAIVLTEKGKDVYLPMSGPNEVSTQAYLLMLVVVFLDNEDLLLQAAEILEQHREEANHDHDVH